MCVMHALIAECRNGIPPLVEELAEGEQMPPERMARAIAEGQVTVPANPRRKHRLCAIGAGCRVKVNVNVGTSASRCNETLEVEKGLAAIGSGADTLMDLSTGGDLPRMRRKILALDVPVGTVPIYEAVRRAGSAADVDADLLFRVIREHCQQGVDFLTLHCGVNREALAALRADPRILSVVSRGGAFHTAMMVYRDEENPLYAEFDYLLEILKEYDVVASLGDGMRPGSVCDSRRLAKSAEYATLGRLSRRALAAGVQRLVEGPGHIPLDEIGYNVRALKEMTGGAPLYLLGPLPTDIAAGYDHVAAAIGSAIACMHGADFLCMVSPSEHLALPSVEDIEEGTRVTKIAAHIGDTLRVEGSRRRERAMADARRRLDWEEQFRLALFGDLARMIHDRDGMMDTCSMCGDLCAVRMVREVFGDEKAGED
ncbi:MAG: phosphomethylpyrimidine synthase ThiC [Methanomicrobiales archaeon]|nr:phosphomethylpyrimidine synthase ThiC [Methanomicrobiales archaeon]MDI6876639.1 phosphomethylpyrimidine synthase ThiC [Methanomicrobiales archaeon]